MKNSRVILIGLLVFALLSFLVIGNYAEWFQERIGLRNWELSCLLIIFAVGGGVFFVINEAIVQGKI